MIPFNFDYYKPDNLKEAVNVYDSLKKAGKNPLYYSGGTEIITMCRTNSLSTGAVIDIKGIPECSTFVEEKDNYLIGSGIPLSKIAEIKDFPILSKAASFPADHTTRDKLTLGGNICGLIIYKEAIQPLLITDSIISIYGKNGLRNFNINKLFNKRLNINNDDFLIQIKVPKTFSNSNFFAVKKTKLSKVDYPIFSMSAVRYQGKIRAAFSGLCDFPFRSFEVEKALSNTSNSYEKRINEAVRHLPAPIISSIEASSEYREFVLRNTLSEALSVLEGKSE